MTNLEHLTEFDNHQMVIGFYDKPTDLRGHIAIHSTRSGLSVGGTRLMPYKTDADALEDALRLSKAMSYKCALAGLPYGGGKSVIIGKPSQNNKKMLMAYARVIENLGGLFKTGTDVGISDKNVSVMANGTRHMIGAVTLHDPAMPTTGETAALGVFYAIKASLKHRYGSPSLKGRRIGIKGVGKLGGHLTKLLHEAGAVIIIGDVDKTVTTKLQKLYPDIAVVPPADIHTLELDVYAPCALGHEFNLTNIKTLQAPIIVGGANNQLSSPEVGEALHRREVLYAPDYVANAGGLIHVTAELEPGGYDRSVVEDRVKSIGDTLIHIYKKSERDQKSTSVVADEIAQKIINGR